MELVDTGGERARGRFKRMKESVGEGRDKAREGMRERMKERCVRLDSR